MFDMNDTAAALLASLEIVSHRETSLAFIYPNAVVVVSRPCAASGRTNTIPSHWAQETPRYWGPGSAQRANLSPVRRTHHISAGEVSADPFSASKPGYLVTAMTTEYEKRKHLTFEQAEGVEPLPRQLKLRELSQELRADLWDFFYQWTIDATNSEGQVGGRLRGMLYSYHVRRENNPADEFDGSQHIIVEKLKKLFWHGGYLEVFGFIQWLLRDNRAEDLHKYVAESLSVCRASYAVFDHDTIVPISSEAEAEALQRAFADLAVLEFRGARAHLREAGSKLTEGDFAGSIRESIHAVEGVARALVPSANTLPPALAKLEGSVRIHGALRAGFNNLYGFTSDENGIRHALLDMPAARVDETDALYMLGSCAAFVSYLINKARYAGLLDTLQD